MRRVVFRDIKGYQGSITDELTVNYQGRWQGEIEECLQHIAEDYAPEERFDHIVVELPENVPIDSVERVDLDHRDG